MTNTALLKEYIYKSGLKVSFISEQLFISRSALYQKIENKSDFRQKEIRKLCELLEIEDPKEQAKIFLS